MHPSHDVLESDRLRNQSILWILQGLAFLGLVSVWIWQDFRSNLLGHPFIWISNLSGAALQVLGFAHLAPLPWRWAKHRWGIQGFLGQLGLAILAAEAWITLVTVIQLVLRYQAGLRPPLLPALLFQWSLLGPLLVVVGGLAWARQQAEEQKAAIRREAFSAELRALQGQLQPHALYNALNGLAELIEENPRQASSMVRSLSRLLKQIQASIESITIPVVDELRILRDFLYLESLRFGPRLQIHWECDRTLDALSVPPLVLQGLAENALKHGIWPTPTGGSLEVRVRLEPTQLRLEIRNTGCMPTPTPDRGTGLNNLRRRLHLLYAKKASFSLEREGDWTIARILIERSALN